MSKSTRRQFLTNTARAGLGLAAGASLTGCTSLPSGSPSGATSDDDSRVLLPTDDTPGAYEHRPEPGKADRLLDDTTTEEDSIAELNAYLRDNLTPGGSYFLQISDFHLGAGAESKYPSIGDSGLEVLVEDVYPTPRVERVLREAVALDPAPEFLMMTGDMTDHGQPDELAHAIELLPWDDLPIYIARGNHEVALPNLLDAVGWLPYADTSRMAETGFCYTFEALGAHFVVLDSERFIEPKAESEFQWLEAELAGLAGAKVIAVNHRHMRPVGYPPVDYRAGFMQPRADDILQRLHSHPGIEWVVGGHVHLNSWARDGDINLVTNSSLFYDNADLATTTQGMASLYAVIWHIVDGEVVWLARKRFGGETVPAVLGESPFAPFPIADARTSHLA